MKRINIYLSALLSIFVVSSCDLTKLDNYKEPDAEIHGSIFDKADGVTLVEQDLSGGCRIEYVEDYIKGVDNPQKQHLVLKVNGTYRNSRLFASEYLYFAPIDANFIVTSADTLRSWPKAATGAATDRVVLSKGDNELNWTVEPNCRITLVSLIDDKANKQIVAKFKVAKSSNSRLASNYVNQIGLYSHMTQGICGQPNFLIRSEKDFVSPTASNATVDNTHDPNTVYTLTQAYGPNGNSRLVNGQKYYFRIGARVNTAASKYNYLPETRFTIEW